MGFDNFLPHRTGEKNFLRLLAKTNPRLCLDVGANKGHYTQLILNLTNSKVIAFEPLPKAHSILAKIEGHHPGRLLAVNKGVGNTNTQLKLYFGQEDSEHATFSNEVNQIDYVGQQNKNTVSVEVITLDSFFSQYTEAPEEIDLLKIDTEGYEYEVLIGAQETIQNKKPKFIQIEYNLHQLFRNQTLFSLASLLTNYTVYQLLPYGRGLCRRDVKNSQANIFEFSNFVFVRNDILTAELACCLD